jgi:protein-disulfide isomerase
MKKRTSLLVLFAAFTLGTIGLAPAKSKPKAKPKVVPAASPAAPAAGAGLEKQVGDFVALYLPWDPETRVTVEKSTLKLPGFSAWHVVRSARYESLKADAVVFVSNDRKWFFEGDSFLNQRPQPVRTDADINWVTARYADLLHAKVTAQLVPSTDAAGMKGIAVVLESGFGPVHVPGHVSADGSVFLAGTLWDFQGGDPRAERRRKIDLTAQRASGAADAPVTIVEYADMECQYCRYRGRHLDKLLAANVGIVSVRRHYKFFPLWSHHAWAMKAASAADCLFKLAGDPALLRFKELAYGRQENMSVSAVDELAITSAEGEGVSRPDYLGCYLRDESFDRVRKDIDEGYRLGVNSTPTYFVDGTQINWIDDKVMEDFLRTKFPRIKTIVYEK